MDLYVRTSIVNIRTLRLIPTQLLMMPAKLVVILLRLVDELQQAAHTISCSRQYEWYKDVRSHAADVAQVLGMPLKFMVVPSGARCD